MYEPTTGMPVLKPVRKIKHWQRRRWVVVEPWPYRLPNKMRVVIPVAFVFDGASVPRAFTSFAAPTGILFVGSILHDFAYRNGYLPVERDDGTTFDYTLDRKGADDLLFEILDKDTGAKKWFSWTVWSALRLFGRKKEA